MSNSTPNAPSMSTPFSHSTAHTAYQTVNVRRELADYFARRRVYKQTRKELSALSDHALADLGLNRTMIKSVAHAAAFGEA